MNHKIENSVNIIPDALVITDSAVQRLLELVNEENKPQTKLRVFVAGGGCAGLQYGFSFDEKVSPDDAVIIKQTQSLDDIALIIDPISFQYLSSATIDYKQEGTGPQFIIHNPAVKRTCQCGGSAEKG